MRTCQLTGKDIALAAAEDFEKFFKSNSNIKIRIEVGDTDFATTKGQGDKTRIIISQTLATDIIDSPKKLYFLLLILGHEIAHVINTHNEGSEQLDLEYRSLEMWADFYGAKVTMCLITFGEKLRAIHLSIFPDANFENSLDVMGHAAARLVTDVYSLYSKPHLYLPNNKYPDPLDRVRFITNGIQSFLLREIKQQDPSWLISVILRMFAQDPIKKLVESHTEQISRNLDKQVRLVNRWHRKTQDNKTAITPGLKPDIDKHLNTKFDKTDDELELAWQSYEKKLQKLGFLS
uniref:Uncharacterized protein n=1 Tax=Zymomonas mobilis subsp. mobilis TaxID=120045 RepID=A0A1Z1NE19_ZYMMB|nr:hypothetical protein B9T50_09115 [Zymomonas mobilis subsp. mobilis]